MSEPDHNGSVRTLLPGERRERIATRLRTAGSITVAALQAEFGVSPMTARRDLATLERHGRARRTHGGAVAPEPARGEDSFATRMARAGASKARLAQAAGACVGDGEAIFADSSTTAYYAVRELLAAGRRVTVITNSVAIMALVAGHEAPNVSLIGVGGMLRPATSSFVGPQAVEAIGAHFADKLLFSVTGVTGDGVLTEADGLEAEVKREMLGRAREAVLLLDGSKLGRTGLAVVGSLGVSATVIVADATRDQVRPLELAGLHVERLS